MSRYQEESTGLGQVLEQLKIGSVNGAEIAPRSGNEDAPEVETGIVIGRGTERETEIGIGIVGTETG